jgi:hypothetical protein
VPQLEAILPKLVLAPIGDTPPRLSPVTLYVPRTRGLAGCSNSDVVL